MTKKALVIGLSAAILASLVGGAFGTQNAQAADSYGNTLYCQPSVQSVTSGQAVSFSAWYAYPTFYVGNLTWSAVGGYPSSGTGSAFSTIFYTSSINETRIITVTDGYQTASCTVYVYGNPYPTWSPTPWPTPYPGNLQCSPSYSVANSGERVRFSAWGGDGSYSWYAPEGSPDSGDGRDFRTRFRNYDSWNVTRWVTVTDGYQSATCSVTVYPENGWTPTPTPSYVRFSMDHEVANLTRGGEGSSVNAYNGDRIQFTTRITVDDATAEDVHIRDWLPSYMTYVYGSTTVDGRWYQDGIATGATNDSLALGNLSPNRTYAVRFEATLTGAPNTTLTNSVNVHVRYATDQNRTSKVKVKGSYVTPTPTAWPTPTVYPTPYPGNGTLTLSITGRNVTRGQSGEYTSVRARGGDTLDLILHVRAADGSSLTNVTVTDFLPAGVAYIPNTTSLNGYLTGDSITSSGLNIGSLAYGQTATIRFSVRADANAVPSWGEVTIVNRAQARADNAGTVGADISMTLGQNVNVSAVAGVKTGPADSALLALLVAGLATAGYAAYTRTALFNRRAAAAEIRQLAGRAMDFSR